MTATEVTGCSDCPFRENYDGMGQFCHLAMTEVLKLPDAEHDDHEVDTDEVPEGETPDWCPLRKGPATILLKSASCPECGANGYQDGEKLHGLTGHGVCSKLKG